MKKIALYFYLITFSLTSFSQTVTLELINNSFSSPVDIQNAGDDRLFIVEQAGIIRILNADGTANPTPFLDITSQVSSGGERGLLGLAFHPDYVNNGYFYVYYTNNSGDTQVSRFSVSGNPNIADATSEFPLITQSQPFSNHNGGCIQFGPDGFLYIGLGDGGSGGDPGNRAQNLTTLLGKLLRIDVDNTTGTTNYAIPPDNPFIADTNALDEIWAYGLRNPWRFSFDLTDNNIWIADVGQNQIEEVNRQPVTEAGLNYGWRCYEGNQPFNTSGCPNQSTLTFPLVTYTHSGSNCSITGGYVYRGTAYSDIAGLYFYADLCSQEITTVDASGTQTNHGSYSGTWVSFGEDVNKELYIADANGSIYKIHGGVLATPEHTTNQVSVYPNPAKDSLQVDLINDSIQSLILFDLKGNQVLEKNNINAFTKKLKFPSLEKGIYLLKINTNAGKIIIKKITVN